VVATTDLLAEGRHFRRAWSSAYDVGRKAAAQSLADVAAMGARPTALLVALALPADLPADWPLDLADGLRDEGARVGASVVGGDLVRDGHITIAVAALGDLGGRDPITRGGARPGDRVAVAGRLGWSAAGPRCSSKGRPTAQRLPTPSSAPTAARSRPMTSRSGQLMSARPR
jgi:thiamine-monophosphate kinase